MPKEPHSPCLGDALFSPLPQHPSLHHTTCPLTIGHCHSGIPMHGLSWELFTFGTRSCSSELGLSSSPALGAHPIRGTGEAAGGLWGADKAGHRPSLLCPKVPLVSRVLVSQNVYHCSLGRVRGRRHSLV